MALTRTLRPLILMSLLVMALANSSYGHNTQNIPQNNPLGLDIPVNPVLPDQLNNLDDNPVNVDVNDLLSKQDQYDQYSPVSQGNNNDFVPSEPISYDNLKPEGTLNVVPTKLQQYEGLIPSINTIGIQGVFLCKSEHFTYDPLVGVVAKITCPNLSYDQNGYQNNNNNSPFSILSHATDANGFFLVTLPLSDSKHLNLKECIVSLEHTSSQCNVPTDVNNGNHGANLSLLRTINDKVYYSTVQPLIYTYPETNSQLPNNDDHGSNYQSVYAPASSPAY